MDLLVDLVIAFFTHWLVMSAIILAAWTYGSEWWKRRRLRQRRGS